MPDRIELLTALLNKRFPLGKDQFKNEGELQQALAIQINSMIQNNLASLVRKLYEADVKERSVTEAFESGENIPEKIASLIIEREKLKIDSEGQSGKENISNEERW